MPLVSAMRRGMEKAIAVVMSAALLPLPMGAQSQVQNSSQSGFVMKVNAELVLTNVVVRDAKTGQPVRGLKQSDFTIYENGKKQQIATFDFQSVDMATPLNEATVTGRAAGQSPRTPAEAAVKPRTFAITG